MQSSMKKTFVLNLYKTVCLTSGILMGSSCKSPDLESNTTARIDRNNFISMAGQNEGGGYFSQVMGHLKGHATAKLKQVAMDSDTQRQLAALTCKQLPEAQRARCFNGLVGIGLASQGIGGALGTEISEAKAAIADTLENPEALVSGAVQIGTSAVTDPNYLKSQALALRDDALDCGKDFMKAVKEGDVKSVASYITHAGLLLVPMGKAAKAAHIAEEVNLASHAATMGARIKVATDTVRGTGCSGTRNSDGSYSTTLTVETPLLNPPEDTREPVAVY